MAHTDSQRIALLERQVRFLQQRLTPSSSSVVTSMETRLAALEAMLDYGDSSGFLDFGASSKGNAWPGQNSGYERAGDRLFGSGQLFVRTMFDAPTILFARGEVATDNQNVGRIDFVPCDEDGVRIYPNGSDDAAGAIGLNLHVPSAGAAPADGHSHFGFQVINELESTTTKPPRTVLMVTGENGGEVWAYNYNSSGVATTTTKLFP